MNNNWAQVEREQLCDLFLQVGPDAPTLCAGWLTRDLAAHLVVREGRPDANLGILIKPLAGRTARVQQEVAARPWPELVDAVRNGPPLLSAFRIPGVDRLANLAEFFVHHEDVRRAAAGWLPRELPEAEQDALWRVERAQARAMFARIAVPAQLTRKDGAGENTVVRPGSPRVTISGPVGELVLFTFGRRTVAQVEFGGDDKLVEKVRTSEFGV